jgi:hypothetical protein
MLQELVAEEDNQAQTEGENVGPAEPSANAAIRWPTQDLNPVNEYRTEGYITMAFPTLFPYGKADLRDQSNREQEVETAEYFDALLRYKDGRFGSHAR